MIVALASPRVAATIEEGLGKIRDLMSEASKQGAEIICFPEAYLPGLRGQDFEVPDFDPAACDNVVATVCEWAANRRLAVILGLEKAGPAGRQIVACVIDEHGAVLGTQTKNQLDPSEDRFYVPGDTRRIFEVRGVRFGVTICHEGWRYPETVRWAAARGASIVFHQSYTGSDRAGVPLTEFGSAQAPYYEKAMVCRALENTVYFASVNYALAYQESATALIAPTGECLAYLPYGTEGVLVQKIDAGLATGLLAARFAPGRYQDEVIVTAERPDTADARLLIGELEAELEPQYPRESRHGYSVEQMLAQQVAFFLVREGATPVACGGVQLFGTEYGELKRMYVRPRYRGRGFAKRILEHLAGQARSRGVGVLRLETGIHQAEAIGLYERAGFRQIPPFGAYKEDPLSRFYELLIF